MSFKDFQFHPHLQARITSCGYVEPTPIQKQAIHPILQGHDIFALAQTGTGKTGAFVLPMLQSILGAKRGPIKALIISPTRELAEQTVQYIHKFTTGSTVRTAAVYGGVSKQAQISRIRNGVDIIVACPGRLLDLIHDSVIDFSSVKMLVLDEADQMLDKGFLPDIRRIVKKLPQQRQNLVFSATMPADIRSLADDLLVAPVSLQIDHDKAIDTVSHVFMRVAQGDKVSLLQDILLQDDVATAIIFTRTKHRAKSLAMRLAKNGHKATSLQGNLSQIKRQQALNGFRDGNYTILVATDIAARGIDVAGISHIINFDMPETVESYTHRTGRTGRARQHGSALSFITEDNRRMAELLERKLGGNLVYQAHRREITISGTDHDSGTSAQRLRQKRTGTKRAGGRSQRNRSLSFDFGIKSCNK